MTHHPKEQIYLFLNHGKFNMASTRKQKSIMACQKPGRSIEKLVTTSDSSQVFIQKCFRLKTNGK